MKCDELLIAVHDLLLDAQDDGTDAAIVSHDALNKLIKAHNAHFTESSHFELFPLPLEPLPIITKESGYQIHYLNHDGAFCVHEVKREDDAKEYIRKLLRSGATKRCELIETSDEGEPGLLLGTFGILF